MTVHTSVCDQGDVGRRRSYRMLTAGLVAASISIAGIALPATAGDLPTASPESAGLAPDNLEAATKVLQEAVDNGKVAGVIAAIMRKGKLVYFEKVGFLDMEKRTPLADDTIFQIRSMSKPITAVATLILVERGKLSLSDPLAKYLPEFEGQMVFDDDEKPDPNATHKPARAVTIEDMLLHTSGLNHRFSQMYRDAQVRSRSEALPTLVKRVAAVPLMNDPGTKWRYSISPTVLGRVIEVVSGQPFDAFLEESIFKPLGMTHTGFHVTPENVARLSTAYKAEEDGTLNALPEDPVPFTQKPALLEGAAGLVSTTKDYLRFSQMLLNGGELDGVRILKAATVKEMTRNHLPDELLPMSFSGIPLRGYGWGLNIAVAIDRSQFKYAINNGEYFWGGSLGTRFWIDPTTETITIFMAQITPALAGGLAFKWKSIATKSADE